MISKPKLYFFNPIYNFSEGIILDNTNRETDVAKHTISKVYYLSILQNFGEYN